MLTSLPIDVSKTTIEYLSTDRVKQPFAYSTRLSHAISPYGATTSIDVLTGEDLFVGTVMALALACTVSFLQSRRSQNDFILWEKNSAENPSAARNISDSRVFGAEAWKEIARPENYVFYNRKIKNVGKSKSTNGGVLWPSVEQTWVLVALLALFVPIFSVEFFFALSRQVVCEGRNPISTPDWAVYLCSPADTSYIPKLNI